MCVWVMCKRVCVCVCVCVCVFVCELCVCVCVCVAWRARLGVASTIWLTNETLSHSIVIFCVPHMQKMGDFLCEHGSLFLSLLPFEECNLGHCLLSHSTLCPILLAFPPYLSNLPRGQKITLSLPCENFLAEKAYLAWVGPSRRWYNLLWLQ